MDWAIIKSMAETFALVLGGLFFIYKFLSGYLVVNLSVKLRCSRYASEKPDWALLVIDVSLFKGDRGSLDIHDASAQITYDGGIVTTQLHAIERSSHSGRGDVGGKFKKLNWNIRSQKSPFLRLSPGEETQLASKCLVPQGRECLMESFVHLSREQLTHLAAGLVVPHPAVPLPPAVIGLFRDTQLGLDHGNLGPLTV